VGVGGAFIIIFNNITYSLYTTTATRKELVGSTNRLSVSQEPWN